MNKQKTIDLLKRELQGNDSLEESLVKISIPTACFICGEDATAELSIKELESCNNIALATAEKLYKEGWREGSSRKFATVGHARKQKTMNEDKSTKI